MRYRTPKQVVMVLLSGLALALSMPTSAMSPHIGPTAIVELVSSLSLPSAIQSDEGDSRSKQDIDSSDGKKKEEELTLERLFPEKSIFGPSASQMAFSSDGQYAAYLYRPYIERRHGSDLWIYNVETGESRRVTSVSVMSEFQEATRKVKEDRVKKAKKRQKEQAGNKDESEKSKEKVKAQADDGLSGEWHGILMGDEEFGIPPEGVAFILSLELKADGSVGGTFRSTVADATVTEGSYNTDTGELNCTLVDPESGLSGSLSATIEDGSLTGALTTTDPPATFNITASREVKTAGESQSTTAEQKSNQGESDSTTEKADEVEKNDGDVELGDIVDEKDADDDKAPRYGGIMSFEWAPESNELIFVSAGDLYRYTLDDEKISRLTKTSEFERDVQYLPDGSGYTYRSGNGIMKVMFGSHLVEQIDPRFPGGEDMSGYEISPDGTRIAFTTTKGQNFWEQGRTVNIVNYRQRFAQVREVTRHMPDDPKPDIDWSVYVYEIRNPMTEEGKLHKVFSFKQTGPRDTVNGPEWALDSSRIAFTVYQQSTNLVRVLEAKFTEEDEAAENQKDGEANGESEGRSGKSDDESADDDDEENGVEQAANESGETPEVKVEEASVVYQFYHNGGPNTPGMMIPYYLPDNRRIALITEVSGFRHLHVLDPMYEQLDQVTSGRYEVYPEGISKDHRSLFVTATKEHPAQRDVYRIDLMNGDMTRISIDDGYYSSVAVNNQGTYALANFAVYGKLRELVAIDVTNDKQTTLTDSHPEEAHKLTEPVPEMFTFKNRQGQDIHGFMFRPDDWSPDDKRPLLIYVYGGPLGTTKMVTTGSYSSDGYFFGYYMAKKHGYVTCTIDPRGTSGYGGLYEKSNYEQVGRPQVEDLVDAANWFVENQGVDRERIGIHGWSFGGFQTQMCLYTEPDVFACGIAGAGPTEWENYNSWYSTGTIGPSREGKTDLSKFSLLPLAKNLKAKLLLIHGMEDSNVLYQDTVRVYRELLKAGKETLVELFLDPTGGHGLGGDVKRLGRFRKYEEFLLRTLGTGKSVQAAQEVEQSNAAAQPTGEWMPIFNGKDLSGWTPKFAGEVLGKNYKNTFRVEDGVLKVAYDDYDQFDGKFGHLFYKQPYSHYRLRLEYRFVGDQTPGAPGWAYRNNGIMIHGQPPDSMRIEQDFPVSIEVQLLGGDGENERPTGNVCTPGTHVVKDGELKTQHCINSTGPTIHGDEWVKVEVEVRGHELIRHFINGELVLEYNQPQLDPNDSDANRLIKERGGDVGLDRGTISLQAESHPCEFRNIEIMVLGS